MFEPAVRKKIITLRVEVPAHMFVLSDAYKLERICYNLLSNAVKYTPEGGEIWLRATLRANASGLWWRIRASAYPRIS